MITPTHDAIDALHPDHDIGLPMPLRRGQHRAVDRILAVARQRSSSEEAGVRVQYYAATGSGKTIVSRVVAELAHARVMAFGAPRIDLLGQAYQEYRRATHRSIDAIVVCSTPEIREARGFPPGTVVTTSAEALRTHLETPVPAGMLRVVFFMYQSGRRLVRALRGLAPLDVLVLDEAHRVARPESAYGIVWDDAAIPARLRLAQTATPRPEMAFTGVYGVVADRYSMAEGIADGVLCDYLVQVLGVSDRTTVRLLRAERDRRSVAVANALLTAIEDGRMRRVLTFHRRRTDAHKFARIARQLATARGITVPTLIAQSGLDSPIDRASALARLETSGGIIASPRIYLEGIDVRGIDAVVFVDPKSSEIEISQAVGRALRINPTDPAKVAQIVIPVVVPDGEGAAALLESSEFRRVWEVLRVLAAQDPRLRNAFEAYRPRAARRRVAGLAPSDPDPASASISEDAAQNLTISPATGPEDSGTRATGTPPAPGDTREGATPPFLLSHVLTLMEPSLHLGVDALALADAVTLRAVDGIGDQRSYDIALLAAFVDRAGTTHVAPTFALPDGYPLGARVARLRSDYHAGRLPIEFVDEIERVPHWVQESGPRSAVAVLWPHLLAFEAVHGQAAVSLDASIVEPTTDVPFALGAAVESLRARYRGGLLSREEVQQCESLAGWSWDVSRPTLYQEAVPLLRAFIARFGTSRVPAPSDWPGPRAPRDVIAVVGDIRLAYAAGELPRGDERALEREFALPWTRPSIRPALRRRFAAAFGQAVIRPDFAAAWGEPVPRRPRRRGFSTER
jgi:superfamily II DNA or RNA helicase